MATSHKMVHNTLHIAQLSPKFFHWQTQEYFTWESKGLRHVFKLALLSNTLCVLFLFMRVGTVATVEKSA